MYSWHDVAARTERVYSLIVGADPGGNLLLNRLARYYACGPWAGKLFCAVALLDYVLCKFLDWWAVRTFGAYALDLRTEILEGTVEALPLQEVSHGLTAAVLAGVFTVLEPVFDPDLSSFCAFGRLLKIALYDVSGYIWFTFWSLFGCPTVARESQRAATDERPACAACRSDVFHPFDNSTPLLHVLRPVEELKGIVRDSILTFLPKHKSKKKIANGFFREPRTKISLWV